MARRSTPALAATASPPGASRAHGGCVCRSATTLPRKSALTIAGKARSRKIAAAVGDFVLRRADGFWAYQIAVVVDDALQQVTDVVRGADLLESTARQIYLQRLLGVPTPRYLHVPVVANERGEKLSKQTGATALDRRDPVGELYRAAERLALTLPAGIKSPDGFWAAALPTWAKRVGIGTG